MATTLTLTSPHKKGSVVKDAQALLAKNRFGQAFYNGPIDGDFGSLTAAASYRAHYWAGYPLKDCKPIYGDLLRSYLVPMTVKGAKKLPLAFKLRRAARLRKKQNANATAGVKAIQVAKTYLGVKESPANSNCTPFGKWYGLDGNPWCAMFVSFVLNKVGINFHYSYVPSVVADARAGRNNLYVLSAPKTGCLVCYDWNNDGVFDHIGFYVSWNNQATGKFNALEGNTSPTDAGDQSNGGEVCPKIRGTKDGYKVVFVGYRGM